MRLDTVVIGMDFSPAALETARLVAATLAPRASLVLVHVIERPARPAFLVAETMPSEALELDARAEAEDRLREVAATLKVGGGVTTEVAVGRPDEVLAMAAYRHAADLIAVGPHGNRSGESLLLGTTTDRLVRGAQLPVLVGARVTPRRTDRVLAAVTDAVATPRVLEWAQLLASQLPARITLLHVIDEGAYTHMASLAAAHAHGNRDVERAEVKGELRTQATRWLQECSAHEVDATRVDVAVEHGNAAESILQIARREHAAVIVLGRHGAARGVPALLGSTVRNVLHGARCAMLVTPPAGE